VVASPGGREIGRVSIRVLPDTSKFGTLTETYLKRVEKTLKVSIPTSLDTSGLEADLVKLKARLRTFGRTNKVTFKAEIDQTSVTGAVKTATKKLQTATSTNPAKLKVTAATDDFLLKAREAGKKLAKETAYKLPLDIESELLRQRLKVLVAQLEKATNVTIPVKVREAIGLRQEVERISREIEVISEKAKPAPVTIKIKADTDPVIADVQTLGDKLAKQARLKLPLDVESEPLRLKLAALVEELHRTTSIELPVDLDAKAALRTKVAALVAEIEAVWRIAHPKVPIDLNINKSSLTRVKEGLFDFGKTFINVFQKIGGVLDGALLKRFFTQLGLILFRATAYTTLLGPPILLAAAGATALAPALATTLPILGAMGAAIGVVALGFDALFGPKVDGQRLGGVFDPISNSLGGLKTQIGDLLANGLSPLVAKLNSTAIPVFANGMKQVAVATNIAFREFLKFLTKVETVDRIRLVLAGAAGAVATTGRSFSLFTSAFLGLSVAALPAMRLVADGLLNLAARFNGYVQRGLASGKLQEAITQAVQDTGAFLAGLAGVASDLIRLSLSLEPLARTVFGAIRDGLSSAIQGITTFLDALRGNTDALADLEAAGLGVLHIFGVFGTLIRDTVIPIFTSADFTNFVAQVASATASVGVAVSEIASSAAEVIVTIGRIVGSPVLTALGRIAEVAGTVAEALTKCQIAVDLLAVALTVKLAAALAETTGGIAVRLIFLGVGDALTGVAGAAGAAAGKIRTLGFAAGISAIIESLTAALAKLVAGLRALTIAAFSNPITALIVILGTLAGTMLLLNGIFGDSAVRIDAYNKRLNDLTKGINGLDDKRVAAGLAEINHELDKVFTDRGSNGFGNEDATSKIEALGKAQSELLEKQKNSIDNVKIIVAQSGLAFDDIQALALKSGLDLGKPFSDPATQQAIAGFLGDLDEIKAKTGLSLGAIPKTLEPSIQAWQQYADAVNKAVQATASAFENDTNIAKNFKAPTEQAKALSKAQDDLKKKQKNLGDVEERVHATRIRTYRQQVSANQQVKKAQDAVAESQKKVNAAQKDLDNASFEKFLKTTLKSAQQFSGNIDKVLKAGLNPSIVAQLLEAGPTQANPILEQLVGAHGKRLIGLYNQTQTALDKISRIVVEKARLTGIAVASASDELVGELPDALKIANLKAQLPGITEAEIAKKLGMDPDKVHKIATDFGIMLFRDVSDYLEAHRIKVQVDAIVNLPPGVSINPNPGQGRDEGVRRATGGLVRGPGSRTSDSIKAWLSDMEYVQPAQAVDHYGVAAMEALRHRRVPKAAMAALVNGDYAGVAAYAPGRVSASTAAVTATGSGELTVDGAGMPRTLTLVDADGVFRGQMRIAAARSHRQKRQAERLSRLGTWGD
jgi:bifunctional DNA-binding transcriptional regulator/antitoxin component of YhaV-PrlF toxin-antitoxin module